MDAEYECVVDTVNDAEAERAAIVERLKLMLNRRDIGADDPIFRKLYVADQNVATAREAISNHVPNKPGSLKRVVTTSQEAWDEET